MWRYNNLIVTLRDGTATCDAAWVMWLDSNLWLWVGDVTEQ